MKTSTLQLVRYKKLESESVEVLADRLFLWSEIWPINAQKRRFCNT